jgi:Tfp pilus assembly protein PilV
MKPTCPHFQQGISFVELLIAIVFLSVAIFSLLTLSQASHRTTMDAYFEFLAMQLAKEPIQVFRALGFSALKTYAENPLPDYPLFEWKAMENTAEPENYPGEARQFSRYISLTQEAVEVQPGVSVEAFKVSVTVAPLKQSWLGRWLTREQVALKSLIVKQ